MTPIYIAASSAELVRADRAMDWARSKGFEPTLDWPAIIRAQGHANPPDVAADLRGGWADADLAAVDQAAVVWFLFPEVVDLHAARGACVEFGYALAQRKLTIVSGAHHRHSIFTARANYVAYDDQEVARDILPALRGVAA